MDKDQFTIGGAVIGWLLLIFAGGRNYQNTQRDIKSVSDRVEALENKPEHVLEIHCLERREASNRETRIQFDAGQREFSEIKAMILENDRANNIRHAENDKANNKRHAETIDMMKTLLQMNRQ